MFICKNMLLLRKLMRIIATFMSFKERGNFIDAYFPNSSYIALQFLDLLNLIIEVFPENIASLPIFYLFVLSVILNTYLLIKIHKLHSLETHMEKLFVAML